MADGAMSKRKLVVHARPEDGTELQRCLKWPEQVIYELMQALFRRHETMLRSAIATTLA